MKKNIFYVIVLGMITLILLRSGSVIRYTREAMIMCYEIIIPTLFPFFVCSGLLIYSGFGSVLAKAAQSIMRPLFNVAPSGAAAFVLGIISGFPLGAVTTVQLYQCGSLSKSEAERLLSFCNNSGPLFIIGSVGAAIYGKPIYGVTLYVIHILSSVAVGILFRGYGRKKHSSPPMRLDTNNIPLPEVFSTALTNAMRSMLSVCFTIIFFSAVSNALLELTPLPSALDAAVSGLCEFSTGTLKISLLNESLSKKLIMTSFIVGFSGLSVHAQVMAVTAGSGLSLVPYISGKALHAIIAAALTSAAMCLMPPSVSVFSHCSSPMSAAMTTVPMLLAVSSALFLIFFAIVGRYNRNRR